MELKRFDNYDNNYQKITKPEIDQKIEILEYIVENWNKKLKKDFIKPGVLMQYNLNELKKIQLEYLHEEYNISDEDTDNDDVNKPDDDTNKDDVTKPEPNKEDDKTKDSENNPVEEKYLQELKDIYLVHESVKDIRIEKDSDGTYFVFDVVCETEIHSVADYNGYKLKYNHICDLKENFYNFIYLYPEYNNNDFKNYIIEHSDKDFSDITICETSKFADDFDDVEEDRIIENYKSLNEQLKNEYFKSV